MIKYFHDRIPNRTFNRLSECGDPRNKRPLYHINRKCVDFIEKHIILAYRQHQIISDQSGHFIVTMPKHKDLYVLKITQPGKNDFSQYIITSINISTLHMNIVQITNPESSHKISIEDEICFYDIEEGTIYQNFNSFSDKTKKMFLPKRKSKSHYTTYGSLDEVSTRHNEEDDEEHDIKKEYDKNVAQEYLNALESKKFHFYNSPGTYHHDSDPDPDPRLKINY